MLDIFNAFDVSASGMYAERIRMNTIASNLANYESYKTDGTPYQKLEPVFQTHMQTLKGMWKNQI